MVPGRQPHQLGDHRHRNWRRKVLDDVQGARLQGSVDDSGGGLLQSGSESLRRSPCERLGDETAETGVPGWFEVDEGLPDVSSPRRPLSWVDTAVQILVDLIGLEPVTEVTPEAIPILEDGRDVVVAGEEGELPRRVIERR